MVFQPPPEAKIWRFGVYLTKWRPPPRGGGGLPKLAELSFGFTKFSGKAVWLHAKFPKNIDENKNMKKFRRF